MAGTEDQGKATHHESSKLKNKKLTGSGRRRLAIKENKIGTEDRGSGNWLQ